MTPDSRQAYCEATARELLGEPSRRLGRSKRRYLEENPDAKAVTVFNANVCMRADPSWSGFCWWGDLDLSRRDEDALVELARRVGETVFVLEEMDGRAANRAKPLLGRAVYTVSATGEASFDRSTIERGADGALRTRLRPHS